jgi:hypothetical protein
MVSVVGAITRRWPWSLLSSVETLSSNSSKLVEDGQAREHVTVRAKESLEVVGLRCADAE